MQDRRFGQPIETVPSYAEPCFRAYEVVAELELPAGTMATPLTYMHDDKQYIVVAIGSPDVTPECIALALH